jgi:hypothetical protein
VSELERGKAIGVDLPDVRELPWLKIQAPEGMDKVPTVADLGAGEKEVLALGLQLPGAVVILDERLGRLHAEALKLAFTGTLGILLRAKVEAGFPGSIPYWHISMVWDFACRRKHTRQYSDRLANEVADILIGNDCLWQRE